MMITGHKTRDVFDRYNIVSAGAVEEAARRVDERVAARMVTKTVTIGDTVTSRPCEVLDFALRVHSSGG